MRQIPGIRQETGMLGSLDNMFKRTGVAGYEIPRKDMSMPAPKPLFQSPLQQEQSKPQNMPMTKAQMDEEYPMNNIRESEQIKADEGFRTKVYMDTTGHLTVGTGHKLTSEELKKYKLGDTFDADELDEIYENDLEGAYASARKLAPEGASPEVIDILTNMSFQMGEQGVRNFRKMHKALATGDYREAGAQMKDSLWYKQTPNRSGRLVERMEALGNA